MLQQLLERMGHARKRQFTQTDHHGKSSAEPVVKGRQTTKKTRMIDKQSGMEHPKEQLAMKTPPVVSQQEWDAARKQLLVKEKAVTRSRDALAAERRRMPWVAVQKRYEF